MGTARVKVSGTVVDQYDKVAARGEIAGWAFGAPYAIFVPVQATKLIEILKEAGISHRLYDDDDWLASANSIAENAARGLSDVLEPGTSCSIEFQLPMISSFGSVIGFYEGVPVSVEEGFGKTEGSAWVRASSTDSAPPPELLLRHL